MSALDNAFKELRRVYKKFDIDGSFEKNGQANAKWPQTLARSAETDYFYDLCEPVDVEVETGLTPICFLTWTHWKKVRSATSGQANPTRLN